jgi:hypothetical protein
MIIRVGDPVPDTHVPHSFEVEVTAMFGDGDGYETVVVGPFPADHPKAGAAITSLVETLQRMEVAYPNGRGGGDYDVDTYNHVEGYEAWFGGFRSDTEEAYLAETRSQFSYEEFLKHDFLEEFSVYPDWPRDPYAYNQGSFESFAVFYYDTNRVKYTVAISADSE